LRTLLVVLVAVEVVVPVLLLIGCNSILFHPGATRPESGLLTIEKDGGRLVRVARPDGRRLAAYDVAPPGLPPDAPVVLYLHGNAGDIAGRAWTAARFARVAQVRLLMPDWSGFGGNEGSPSETELNTDALAAYDHLFADGVPAARIVVYGESIGGAPALFVAKERPVAGVAVQSTFSSLSSMALRVYPWMPLGALLVAGSFPNTDRIAALDVPVLVVHGRNDAIVPFAEGERLFAAAKPGAEFLPVEGADHNDLFDVAGDDYLRGLGERFRKWTRR
jgi:fermentation-respiration switch protein FrsA (DUF1100 family)